MRNFDTPTRHARERSSATAAYDETESSTSEERDGRCFARAVPHARGDHSGLLLSYARCKVLLPRKHHPFLAKLDNLLTTCRTNADALRCTTRADVRRLRRPSSATTTRNALEVSGKCPARLPMKTTTTTRNAKGKRTSLPSYRSRPASEQARQGMAIMHRTTHVEAGRTPSAQLCFGTARTSRAWSASQRVFAQSLVRPSWTHAQASRDSRETLREEYQHWNARGATRASIPATAELGCNLAKRAPARVDEIYAVSRQFFICTGSTEGDATHPPASGPA